MRYFDVLLSSRIVQEAIAPLGVLPIISWITILALALFTIFVSFLLYSLFRSLVGLFSSTKSRASLLVRPSQDGFVMINWLDWNAEWLGGAKLQDKESGLLVTYVDESGKRKRARGTARGTTSKSFPQGTVGLPEDVAVELGLKLGDDPIKCEIQIMAVNRFFLEKLWNNPDDAIKISFRTTAWVTAISILVAVVNSVAFEYFLCRGCMK